MPVPNSIAALSKNPAENSPAGTESAKGTIDDYFRAAFAFIKQLADLAGGPTVTLPSAALVAIGFAGSANITITGTTTISAFDVTDEGATRLVTFTGVLTLKYNAASMILPGAADIVTRAGDVAVFKSLGAGNWKCMLYERISGTGPVAASMLTDGYLSAGDWNSFNSRMTPAAAAAQFVDAAGDAMTGQLTIDTSASGGGQGLSINNIAGVPQIRLAGAGGIKFIRLNGNTLEVVNQAYSAVIMGLDDVGNLTSRSHTSTSDERLKKKWRRAPADLLQRVAGLRKLGGFLWKKGGAPGIGGSAQELEAIWPEAVHTDAKGFKSVHYGQAAFVIAVELTRAFFAYVAKTDKRLAKLEGRK